MAESRGERYYICVIGQISLACEIKMEKEREKDRGGRGYVTAMSFLISEFSLAFNPLPAVIRVDTYL